MIYFDNAATTKVNKNAADTAYKYMTEIFGNPSSIHNVGLIAKKSLNETRESLADIINCKKYEIYFTSGGTEANNLAISGCLQNFLRSKGRIITSLTEHSSVLNVFKAIEAKGIFEVVYLKPEKSGEISIDSLKSAITEDTVFISLMFVNNETGSINPVSEIRKIADAAHSKAIIHSDCVAAFGKVEINVKKLNVDLLTVSGHKINAPKGVGAVYANKNAKLKPLVFGGNHENGIRAGTENVPAIAALNDSLKFTFTEHQQIRAHYENLYNYLLNKLKEMPVCKINTDENSSHAILNISISGVPSEAAVRFLQDKDIYISPSSACTGSKGSHVLSAMQLAPEYIKSAIRISFGHENTTDEIDCFIEGLKETYEKLKGKRI